MSFTDITIGSEESALKPKPNGRITLLEARVDELQKANAKLRHDVNTLVWLAAANQHNQKMAAAAQVLQDLVMLKSLSGGISEQQSPSPQKPGGAQALMSMVQAFADNPTG